MQDIPSEVGYREELIALQPIVVGENWNTLDRFLRGHYAAFPLKDKVDSS